MKKILTIVVMLVVAVTSWAVPAAPSTVKVQQPDGSYVTIKLHGDEWLNYTTTEDGYTVVKNEDGYYVYAQKQDGQLMGSRMPAHDAKHRQATEQQFVAGLERHIRPQMDAETARRKAEIVQHEAQKLEKRRAKMKQDRRAAQYDYKNFRGLVILVQFNDRQFSRSDYPTIANDMINQENYNGFGTGYNVYTGSVRDYFSDNSNGNFKPVFDVVGPVTVDYSQYDARYQRDSKWINRYAEITYAAVSAADDLVNYADYDRDNDGFVDMIYFVFAGNGSNYSGNDQRLWWPHRSGLRNGRNWIYLDGVFLYDYASSTELYGRSGSSIIDGIGTICHEFSHVLGLPDFYDTNYEENGQSNDPGGWSVMAGGSYENYSRTPVGYSLFERWSVGFADDPQVINAAGDYTLNPLFQEQKGYRINTPVENEYFLLENRQKNLFKWDKYLPGSGLLVHRVDFTNENVWNNNTVNADPDHNYYEVIRANGPHKSNGNYVASADDIFPAKGKTELSNETSPANLKTWNKTDNEWALTGITMSNGIITFQVSDYELEAITIEPSSIVDLPIGVSRQLSTQLTPSAAKNTLSWSSDDASIASVDENGKVKGISAGTTTIRVISDNFIEATCQVTVKDIPTYRIADFKQQATGTALLLNLDNAEVLTVYNNTAYVRDATGSIMVNNGIIGLKKNDRITGVITAQINFNNKMPEAILADDVDVSSLYITAGDNVEPREVSLDKLTEADYCDYVLVKQARLINDGGAWAVNAEGQKTVRLWNKFAVNISRDFSKEYSGNYYDIPAIYGTDTKDGEVINELYMMATPTKVSAPTGIDMTRYTSSVKNDTYYNLNGQRVDKDYKGIVIVNGKKVRR